MDDQLLKVSIGDLVLLLKNSSPQLKFQQLDSIFSYFVSDCKLPVDYEICYSVGLSIQLSSYQLSFTGEPGFNDFFNYNWYIYRNEDKIAIVVDCSDHKEIKQMVAFISPNSSNIRIQFSLHSAVLAPISIDPLIHPLGSLLMIYLFHWNNGALIHASAVEDENGAYLFTGVSGIGKSTMAALWKKCGARVLNDDRLVLRLINNEVKIYNNPMPHYKQEAMDSTLKKIFLLKQASQNYIKPLGGALAYSRVLGNFIQQFYSSSMVRKHLEIIERMINRVRVYEVGFKPDTDIVHMIKKMNNDE